jgi:hypothetical protein
MKMENYQFDPSLVWSRVIAKNLPNPVPFLVNVLKVISLLNKRPELEQAMTAGLEATNNVQTSLSLFDSLKKQVKEAQENIDEKRLIEFMNATETMPLLEADVITQLIEEALTGLSKAEEISKKKILIIDDLDRIDPEHIFRLFNVFGSHFDYRKESENKFGFDTVMFVCDIENIRSIYHSKYGVSTDFSGYIDKFYTGGIFYFNNTQGIKNGIQNILKSIRVVNTEDQTIWRIVFPYLEFILQVMVFANAINMRILTRLSKSTYSFVEQKVTIKGTNLRVLNHDLAVILIIEALDWIFGHAGNVKVALEKTRNFSVYNDAALASISNRFDYQDLLAICLQYLGARHHKLKGQGNAIFTYSHNLEKVEVRYAVGSNFQLMKIESAGSEKMNSGEAIFFILLEIAYDLYHK